MRWKMLVVTAGVAGLLATACAGGDSGTEAGTETENGTEAETETETEAETETDAGTEPGNGADETGAGSDTACASLAAFAEEFQAALTSTSEGSPPASLDAVSGAAATARADAPAEIAGDVRLVTETFETLVATMVGGAIPSDAGLADTETLQAATDRVVEYGQANCSFDANALLDMPPAGPMG